jgi:hypothetical protein
MRLWTAIFMRDFPTDILEIRDYDPAWPDVFAKLAARARTSLGSYVLTVEHIGSMSVPGQIPIYETVTVRSSDRLPSDTTAIETPTLMPNRSSSIRAYAECDDWRLNLAPLLQNFCPNFTPTVRG